MKLKDTIAFPDEDEFMVSEMIDKTYQQSHVEAVLRYVKNFDTAIDGGAHVGLWTIQFSKCFERVLSFEPSTDTMECLDYNARDLRNVETFRNALHESSGLRVSMSNDAKNLERKNTGARFIAPGDSVQTVAIDDLELVSLGLLKLDIEGAEPYAIKGAEQAIRKFSPIVIFENKFHWNRYGFARSAPQVLLAGYGLRFYEKAGCDEIWGPI